MSLDHLSKMSQFRRGAGLILVLTLGYVAGTVSHQPSAASAGVRNSKNRAAFESGGEQSARILIEISSTLKRIDRRLERIEKTVSSKPNEKRRLTP